MHEGKLEIESALQKGTVARLVFPAGRVISHQSALSA